MATLKDLTAADPGKLPPAKLAEAYHQGTVVIAKFGRDKIQPMVDGILSPTDRENCFIGTFLRMGVWMDSLAKLGPEGVAFQSVSAATRGLFELLMDLKLLEADQTNSSAEKFHAFTEVNRFRTAKMFVDYKAAHPGAKLFSDKSHQERVNKPGEQAKIDALVAQHWPNPKGKPGYPEHWSNMKAWGRADHLGDYFSEMYRYMYPITSWNMHPSLAGQGGMGVDTFLRYVALFHNFSQEFFQAGLDILLKELKLNIAIQDLREQLKDLGIQSGLPLIKVLADKIDADAAVAALVAAVPAVTPAPTPKPAAPAPPAAPGNP